MACLKTHDPAKVVRVWPCLMGIEQSACWKVMLTRFQTASMIPISLVSTVNLSFASLGIDYGNRRLAIWRDVWAITIATRTIGGTTYSFYANNTGWSVSLHNCQLAGCCADGENDCPEANFHPPF